jgi:signal transduction histidine kinase
MQLIPIFRRLRWRTRMILTAMLAVLIVGFSVMMLINKLREDYFHYYMAELAKPLASMLSYHVDHNMRYHAPDHFQLFLEEFKIGGDIHSVRILDDTGRVVFSNIPEEVGSIEPIPNEKPVPKSITNSIYVYSPTDSLPTLKIISGIHNSPYCYRCHGDKNQNLGYVEIHVDSEVERKIERMLIRYDLVSFVFFMFLFGVTIIIGHNYFFQAPFNRIKAGIKAIQEGDLNTRIHLDTRGELSQLAESINQMTEKLQQTRKDLDKAYQEKIDRAGQLASIGELAASVAHEIKNPISGIHNAIEIILDQNKELKQQPIFQEILSQINRVDKTIQDLMNFARPRDPIFAPMNIQVVLQQAVSLYRDQLSQEQVSLVESYSPDCPVIHGDSELLKQAFVNLLLNAFQACADKQDGEIRISTECSPDNPFIRITFYDNGKGIPPELQRQIFKPFYTTKHKGTGLGLSLTQSIIMKHHGTITVQSEPGRWTKFTIVLPIKPK